MEVTYYSSVVGAVILSITVFAPIKDEVKNAAINHPAHTIIGMPVDGAGAKAGRGFFRPAEATQIIATTPGARAARGLNRTHMNAETAATQERQQPQMVRARNGSSKIVAG